MRFVALVQKKSSDLILASVVFIVAFSLYASLSAKLEGTASHPFEHFNVLFEIDTPRVIVFMTELSGNHSRTSVHPLYVLLVNPIGRWLKSIEIMGNALTRTEAAIGLNSFIGASNVFLSYLLFRLLKHNQINSFLLAFIVAVSMSQLFMSIVPDTSSLATLSLFITYILFCFSLSKRRFPLWLWVAAGVFSLGVTTTNFFQTLIFFSISQVAGNESSSSGIRSIAKPLSLYVVSVFLVTAFLAIVQKFFYPSTVLFFFPSSFTQELDYASFLIFRQPSIVLGQLLKHFLVVNVVGAVPHIFNLAKKIPWITFSASRSFSPYGYAALFGWATIALISIRFRRWEKHSWFYLGAALSILFNSALHSFYGVGERDKIEFFLYTGNFTFLISAFFFSGIQSLSKNAGSLLLISFLILIAINNLQIVQGIVTLYDSVQ